MGVLEVVVLVSIAWAFVVILTAHEWFESGGGPFEWIMARIGIQLAPRRRETPWTRLVDLTRRVRGDRARSPR